MWRSDVEEVSLLLHGQQVLHSGTFALVVAFQFDLVLKVVCVE